MHPKVRRAPDRKLAERARKLAPRYTRLLKAILVGDEELVPGNPGLYESINALAQAYGRSLRVPQGNRRKQEVAFGRGMTQGLTGAEQRRLTRNEEIEPFRIGYIAGCFYRKFVSRSD